MAFRRSAAPEIENIFPSSVLLVSLWSILWQEDKPQRHDDTETRDQEVDGLLSSLGALPPGLSNKTIYD